MRNRCTIINCYNFYERVPSLPNPRQDQLLGRAPKTRPRKYGPRCKGEGLGGRGGRGVGGWAYITLEALVRPPSHPTPP